MDESHASSANLQKGGGERIIHENKILSSPIVYLRIDPDYEYLRKIHSIF